MRFIKDHMFESISLMLGILIIHAFLLFPPFSGNTYIIDLDKSAKFGDFIGGYIGAIFLLISVILLISTLRHQIATTKVQQFENTFYTLLKIHIDNVNEMQLAEKEGRSIFLCLWREFRASLDISKKAIEKLNLQGKGIVPVTVAYLAFYFGATGEISKSAFIEGLPDNLRENGDSICKIYKSKTEYAKSTFSLQYTPFDGHQSRFNHYYRHLFSIITFIDENRKIINSKTFSEILRAQLSIHEELFLALYALSSQGKIWHNSKHIGKYNLIQDIPKAFINEIGINNKISEL